MTSTGARKAWAIRHPGGGTPNMIGVDISKTHLDAHALPSGRTARFSNNAAGFKKLAAWAG